MKIRIEQLGPAEAPRLRRVRLASLADAPDAFATTLEEAQSFTVEMWREQLSKLVTFVATDERGDAGVVRGATDTEDASTAWLLSMWVAPRARGRGVGDRLVERLLGWAGERGFIRVVLEVADHNVNAIALYERAGFEPTGETTTLPPPRSHVREHRRERILRPITEV